MHINLLGFLWYWTV